MSPRPALTLVPDTSDLLTPSEGAAPLRVRPRTLIGWARDGRIAFVDLAPRKNGAAGCIRFRKADIAAFIEACVRKAAR
ncbi:MAG TPA: helix-turn-helix domain-containing protein [Candidatus Polarisedimenticolia bacterium]|jgi:hypothetical protein